MSTPATPFPYVATALRIATPFSILVMQCTHPQKITKEIAATKSFSYQIGANRAWT
jgi:hypothetical protein